MAMASATASLPPLAAPLRALREAGVPGAGACRSSAPHTAAPWRRTAQRRAEHLTARSSAPAAGFHTSRMTATERTEDLPPVPGLEVVMAESDAELESAAWLRAMSFYVYPPERKFAGELHQVVKAEEEFQLLKASRMARRLAAAPDASSTGSGGSSDGYCERSACLVALSTDPEVLGASPARLLVEGRGAVVGTLDLHAVRALDGQILIGDCQNAAYLGNVCTSPAARRRGVGHALVTAVRQLAREWGVEQLYVHTLAVNEIGRRFYDGLGFVVEKEESSNMAHYRGHCLDGIEGAGRTLLLRDTRLHS